MTLLIIQIGIALYLLWALYVRLAGQKPSDQEQLDLERNGYRMAPAYRLLIRDVGMRRDMLERTDIRRMFFRELSAEARDDVVRMLRSGRLGAVGWVSALAFFPAYYALRLKSAVHTGFLDLFALLGLGMTVFRGLKE